MTNPRKKIGGYPIEQLRIMSEMERRKLNQEIESLRQQSKEINTRLEAALIRREQVMQALELLENE